MKELTFIDFFSGIGGFHSGFEKAGMKCIGWCEFDKFAQKSYRAMYDVEGLWFNNDVRKARGWDVPNASVWTFGFPCQDVSIAGKQRGIKRGTRSGLFFEIMRLLDEAGENKPKWIIAENVRNLLSIGGGLGFFTVLSEMADRGYSIEWKVYNSKNYGVPQNRERVYIVGHLGRGSGRELLPKPREGKAVISKFIDDRKKGMYGTNSVIETNGLCSTLTAMRGGNREPKILISGINTGASTKFLGKPMPNISRCLKANKTDSGIIIEGHVGTGGQKGYVYGVEGNIGCLNASDYKDPKKIFIDLCTSGAKLTDNARCLTARYTAGVTNHKGVNSGILIKNATKKGYLEASPGDGVDLSYAGQNAKGGRVKKQISSTLTTPNNLGVVLSDGSKCYIRKLTPRECWRLQGFTDEQFDKAQAVNSNSQLYKQAGNAVTVNVTYEIGKHIINYESEDNPNGNG